MLRFTLASTILLALTHRASGRDIQFNRDIRPILASRCFKCHGPDLKEGGLRLDQRSGAVQLLDSGNHAIQPGDAANSTLLARVQSADPDARMPPLDAAEALTEAEIATLREWISAGAAWETHWAYVPPSRPKLPESRKREWVRNPIDAFILARLEEEGLSPAPAASKAAWLRRVTLDLIGLPPTSAELTAFVADNSPQAYETVVDRLMASPQYGVRQAIGWLDLARYADTDGYPHDDNRVIWPYRDWVVDAFNADMPFDQFTIEQLAGDLLPDATDAQHVATGFHRNTRINIEAGSDPETYRLEAVFDRVNTTATVWLGSTLACAQCHNHKYDPFTQEDYYRLLAIFNSCAVETTTDESGVVKNVSAKWPVFTAEQQKQRADLQKQWEAATTEEERNSLRKAIDGLKPAKTLVMQEHTEKRPTYIFARGNPLEPRAQVEPGVPAFLNPNGKPVTDRLQLARWLVEPDNPLTARVVVNRIWMQYFGAPLVATPEDFGTQGSLATHEQLLDWLATELIANGWHQKPIVRLIVSSATYRQSAQGDAEAVLKDPTNRLYSRGPRVRLPAEIIRDNALAIAGLLDTGLGGPSVMANSMGAGENLASSFRRSLYVYWKRQQLDETFENLDAPSRDVTCSRRIRTNTPLQALNLLNDRVFMDAARGFAIRILKEAGPTPAERIHFAFETALSRPPATEEASVVSRLFERRLAAFESDPESARQLVTEGTVAMPSESDPAELAAWTLVANTILNLDETFTKE